MPNFNISDEVTILQYLGGETTRARLLQDKVNKEIRCAIPAKIISIDYNEVTCSCQPLIMEKVKDESGNIVSVELPVLLDVPIVFPGSSKFCITFPLSPGDEGLVIFADMCIDSWWQSGDVQEQFEIRRHDLSDGFFIPSQMSQPNKYTSISQSDLEIKSRVSGGKVIINGHDIDEMANDLDELIETVNELSGDVNRLLSHVHEYYWTSSSGQDDTGAPKYEEE